MILDAVDSTGLLSDGRILALGSYENRVYQVGIEAGDPVVTKFYRPGRWTDEAIREEHAFALELAAAEVPVVAPIRLPAGRGSSSASAGAESLFRYAGFRLAIYRRRGGQWPELGTEEDRQWMGRFLGRIHLIGGQRRFEHRPSLLPQVMGRQSVEYLLASGIIPEYIEHRYERVAGELLNRLEAVIDSVGTVRYLRIHGDCHRNNILWTPAGPHFVDLDDCMMGPAIQDLWMLLAGASDEQRQQLDDVLAGYQQFADFDFREVRLIEPLRALRMIHYAAWLARRWDDPAFPKAFPWFADARYWERHAAELEEQCWAIDAE